MPMGFLKSFTHALLYATGFFIVIAIGDALIPGKIYPQTYSLLGVIIFFIALMGDYFFAFAPAPGEKGAH